MRFIWEQGFTLRPDKAQAFQTWLRENEARLERAHPDGVQYLGTYGVVFTSEKDSGDCRIFLAFENYADIELMSAAQKDDNSELGQLVREASEFGEWHF